MSSQEQDPNFETSSMYIQSIKKNILEKFIDHYDLGEKQSLTPKIINEYYSAVLWKLTADISDLMSMLPSEKLEQVKLKMCEINSHELAKDLIDKVRY